MIYFVKKANPKYARMSFEDLWFGNDDRRFGLITANETNTVTYCMTDTPLRLHGASLWQMEYHSKAALTEFCRAHDDLLQAERHELYHTFYVPKSSGGLRRIDAPKAPLMTALRELKMILEKQFKADHLYHTSAFAYIHGRSTIDCVKKHQKNQSKWFGKFDLHNFFGSTTKEFVMSMLSKIYPFNEVIGSLGGREVLEQALDLCFLDGVLPQGTPISPLITNIMMVPIDYTLEKKLRERGLVYSRYADDFLISSRHPFMFREVEALIRDTLAEFGAPFELNVGKTRYGSAAGANWNFGIMLNKDNQMTIGRKKKKQFESMLTAYAKDRKNGTEWALGDVQQLSGMCSYYKMVEGETIDRIIEHISAKQDFRIMEQMKKDLRG